MAVSPELVVFAIRAAVRLGRAVQMELEEHIRNRAAALPRLLTIDVEPVEELRAEIQRRGFVNEKFKGIYKRYLEAENFDVQHRAELDIYAFATNKGLVTQTEQAQEVRGMITIRQWSEEADKGFPMARIGLALVEIVLDYAATNPSVFGVGSNGERFVRAAAVAIDEILPESGTPGKIIITPEQLFGERALAIFMHTGLSTLQAYIADNVEEDHLRDIAVSILKPLVNNFRDGTIERKTLNEFRDLLLGPMAQEAINAVVRNQRQFLGSRFAKDKGLGAATEAILKTIAEGGGVYSVVKREVWIKLYGAVLDVAIQRPELFGGESEAEVSVFGRELVQTVAERLKSMTPPFTESVAAVVVADAIGLLSRHTVILFDQEEPWEKVAGKAVGSVLESISIGMMEGLQQEDLGGGQVLDGKAILARVFSEDQVTALVRIVTDQVARTPGMLIGRDNRDEVKALVSGIARAISDSNRSLLSSEDWLEVAAIVAEEAAKNPGRLFRIIGDNGQSLDPEEEFAVRLIKLLLEASAEDFRTRGRLGGSVLFGETLRHVIIDTLLTAADNVEAAVTNETALITLVTRINALQGDGTGGFGRREWLHIFNAYLKLVLTSENGAQVLENLSDDDLRNRILP